MRVHFEAEYTVAIAGLVAGAVIGLVVGTISGRAWNWDARLTGPLVLAAGSAHAVLIPVVEQQRQVLFGLYFLAMTGVFVLGVVRIGIWRLGAVLFPAGSIAGYFYFAAIAHQADWIGLAVKVVEAVVFVGALGGLLRTRAPQGRPTLA